MSDEQREPELPMHPAEEKPVSYAVRRALLTIADLRDATEKLKARQSSKKLSPQKPDDPTP